MIAEGGDVESGRALLCVSRDGEGDHDLQLDKGPLKRWGGNASDNNAKGDRNGVESQRGRA